MKPKLVGGAGAEISLFGSGSAASEPKLPVFQYFTILDCSRCGGWQKESKLISTTTKKCCLWYSFILQFLCCETEPEPKILQKVEPEPKLNNFGTATLHKCILLYSITSFIYCG